MPDNQSQDKYMTVDEFLTKYYTVLDPHYEQDKRGSGFVWALASDSPQDFFKWYNAHKTQIKSPELQEIYAEIAKAQAAGTPAAMDFLYIIQVLTIFNNYNTDKNPTPQQLSECTKVALHAIEKGAIKKPENSYRLLKRMNSKFDRTDTNVAQALAMHKLSTPDDVYRWLRNYVDERWADGPIWQIKSEPKFTAPIDDVKKKLNDLSAITKAKLDAEMAGTFPNTQTIRSLEISFIPNIAHQIKTIVKHMAQNHQQGQTDEDVNKATALAAELEAKFDESKILEPKNGHYVQQYDNQTEFRVVDAEQKYEQMKREKETAENSARRANAQAKNEALKATMYQGMLHIAEKRNKDIANYVKELGEQIRAMKQAIDTNGGLPISRLRKLEELATNLAEKFEKTEETDEQRLLEYEKSMAAQRNQFTEKGGYGTI